MIDPEISPEDLRKAYRKVNSITMKFFGTKNVSNLTFYV